MAARVTGQVRLVGDRLEPQGVTGPPGSPHGTTVVHILLSLAPEAEVYSIDIFGSRGICEVEVLIRALRLAMETAKCRVINLSLGIQEAQLVQVPRRMALLRTVEEAYFRNVMVIAAASNDHPISRSYPATFGAPVFGVSRHEGPNARDIRYRPQERIEFLARGLGEIGPLASVAASSWATPHVSGVIAQLLSLHPELTPFEVKTLLARINAGRP
jgi:subtilisin family serine protease